MIGSLRWTFSVKKSIRRVINADELSSKLNILYSRLIMKVLDGQNSKVNFPIANKFLICSFLKLTRE